MISYIKIIGHINQVLGKLSVEGWAPLGMAVHLKTFHGSNFSAVAGSVGYVKIVFKVANRLTTILSKYLFVVVTKEPQETDLAAAIGE